MPKTINIFDLLMQDHKKTKKELQALIDACKKDEEVDFERLTQCRKELELHMKLEEKFLYPKAEEEEEVEELASHAYDEHKEVKELLKGLKKSAEPSEIAEILEQVLEDVDHHVQEEEGKFFPKLEKIWDRKMLEEMGKTVSEEKEKELSKK